MQPRLEEAVSRMQQVILLGRQRREEVKINLRKPMRRLTIVHRDAEMLNELRTLEPFIRRELNVKERGRTIRTKRSTSGCTRSRTFRCSANGSASG